MKQNPPPLWYDVTDTLKSGRRTGVQRVVVELARELSCNGRLMLIRFDPWTGWFRRLNEAEEARFWSPPTDASSSTSRGLSSHSLWKHSKAILVPWLVQPLVRLIRLTKEDRTRLSSGVYISAEIMGDPVRIGAVRHLRRSGLVRTVHILHDFLPLTHPEWTTLQPLDFSRHWRLVRNSNLLVAVSHHTRFEAEARRGDSLARIITAYPGPNFGVPPSLRDQKGTAPLFVSIGTVEDRKNQTGLLRAFLAYRDRGGRASLVVVGGPGRGSEAFSVLLQKAQALGYPIEWKKRASDVEVNHLYEQALATVYVSFSEGFGLPVLESLGRGTPCITSNQTSTGELAQAFGGCLTVDPEDHMALAGGMLQFDRDPDLRDRLVASIRHPLPSWSQFAATILEHAEPLRLLVDVSILGYSQLRTQYRTGIFQVSVALLKALSALPGVEVGAYSSSGNLFLCRRALRKMGLASVPVVGEFWSSHLSFLVLVTRNVLYKLGLKTSASFGTSILRASQRLRSTLDRRTVSQWQAYLSPMDTVPEGVRRHPQLISATLIHDLIPLLLPEYAQGPDDPTRWFSRLMKAIRPTDRYFTVSEFTRGDLLSHFPTLPPDRITVAPNAVDRKRFRPGQGNVPERPYFLAVSTIEPRKRLDTVVAGFALYRQAGGEAELVVCGSDRQGHRDRILEGLDESVRAFVRFPGYVSDRDLPALYGQCLGFVSLSEYEGFGLPILEAMSCGAPVIVSPRTSHPEVAGEAGVYVDSDDAPGVAQAMRRLELDPVWRAECVSRSLKGADRFSWDRTARLIIDRFREERESYR